MIIAENINNAYHARKASGNWAEWSQQNPAMAEVLSNVAKHE